MLTAQSVQLPAPARILVADCPWKFDDKLPGDGRGAEKNYACLELHELMRFPLPALAPDAILFFWRVASMQQEALDVIRAWGFTVKSEIVWTKRTKNDKAAIGMGRYVRNAHEVCLIATRGKAAPLIADHGVRSVFELEAPLGKHSAKPKEFFDLVEKLVGTDGVMAEMFGREPRAGWHVFGNEIPSGYTFIPRDGDAPAPVNHVHVDTLSFSEPHTDAWARALQRSEADDADAAIPDDWTGAVSGKAIAQAAREAREVEIKPSAEFACAHPVGNEECRLRIDPESKTCANGHVQNAPLPKHVIPDLGEHPSLTEAPTRLAFVERAIEQGLLKSDASESLESAWIRLQYVAPPGFFRIDPRKVAETPRGPQWQHCGMTFGELVDKCVKCKLPKVEALATKAHNPIENMAEIVLGLRDKGIHTNLIDVAKWEVNDRGRVFAWLDAGGDMTAVPAIVATIYAAQMIKDTGNPDITIKNAGCSACDAGTPFTPAEAFKHTGEGVHCKTETSALATAVEAEEAPKRSKGRPPKKPKAASGAWDLAALRASVDASEDMGPGLA